MKSILTICRLAMWWIRCTQLSACTKIIKSAKLFFRTKPAIAPICCYAPPSLSDDRLSDEFDNTYGFVLKLGIGSKKTYDEVKSYCLSKSDDKLSADTEMSAKKKPYNRFKFFSATAKDNGRFVRLSSAVLPKTIYRSINENSFSFNSVCR